MRAYDYVASDSLHKSSSLPSGSLSALVRRAPAFIEGEVEAHSD